jgi:hypothetical protein
MISSRSFTHMPLLLYLIIEQLYHLCTCPVLPDQLYFTGLSIDNCPKGSIFGG